MGCVEEGDAYIVHNYGGSGGSYRDNLYGGLGDDLIYGYHGDDWIYADRGNHLVYGMGGDDAIHGWLGDDHLEGGVGADTLCDRPCTALGVDQASVGGNYMDGGDNGDLLWYGPVTICPNATLDPASTGGAGADHFGDPAWAVIPSSAVADLTVEPAGCTDPNGP